MYCKIYKTTINSSRTCVARQKLLERYYVGKNKSLAMGRVAPGTQYHGCIGCKVGLKLYRNYKKMESK